jgi:methionyl-tRNA formyltransferase
VSGAARLVFCGTPAFAVPALEAALASQHQVVAVYTQPDRPAGRGRRLSASPVKQSALAAGVPVCQPPSLRTLAARHELAAFAPDLIVVVAYGLILPRRVLALPRIGCWNVHASLLPRWRGAAPIQRALEAGDRETGVCLMQMAEGLDTGPVMLSLSTPIEADESAGELHDRLAALGAQVLADGLTLLALGMRPIAEPQAEAGVTYATKLDKREALLDLGQPAEQLARKVRAFNPWPAAELDLAGERVRVLRAHADSTPTVAAAGTVLRAGPDGIELATGAGRLCLTQVQRPGGRALAAGEYLNARRDLQALAARA